MLLFECAMLLLKFEAKPRNVPRAHIAPRTADLIPFFIFFYLQTKIPSNSDNQNLHKQYNIWDLLFIQSFEKEKNRCICNIPELGHSFFFINTIKNKHSKNPTACC